MELLQNIVDNNISDFQDSDILLAGDLNARSYGILFPPSTFRPTRNSKSRN